MHERERLVDEATAGAKPSDAEAELGLLAPDRARTDPADAVAEAAELGEELPAEGHARSDQVPDGRALGRQPAVGAADDPAELGGKPAGPPFPDRLDRAADAEHILVLVLAREHPKPFGRSDRVVVEEGHDVAAGEGQPAVTRAGQAARFKVGGNHDVRQLGACPRKERRRVIDDDDRLHRRVRLPTHALDRLAQLIPAGTCPCADDHGHRRRRGCAARGGTPRRRVNPRRSGGHDCSGSNGNVAVKPAFTSSRKREAASWRRWSASLLSTFCTCRLAVNSEM